MLQTIISYITTAALSWVAAKFHTWYVQYLQDEATKKSAAASVDPLKKADPTDGKAIDSGSDSALGGF